MNSSTGNYSIIIPVLKPGDVDRMVPLLDSIGGQSRPPAQVHLVAGDKRQGRAINYGVKQAGTKYVATLDDDSVLDDAKLFEKLLSVMGADPSIGMAGAACEIPEWASPLQKRAMREIARRHFPRQAETIDSDMVQHPCLMMEREFFLKIGGEDEELIRGLDPVLRKKVRDAGRRVVIAADTWVYHLIPDSLPGIVKMYFRNGKGSGYAQRHYPGRVLELSDGYDQGSFTERRPFAYRACRRAFGLAGAVLSGRFIRAATDIAYSLGVAREKLFPSAASAIRTVDRVEAERRPGHPFELVVHSVTLG